MRRRASFVFLVVVAVVAVCSIAAAHPGSGYAPRDIPYNYGQSNYHSVPAGLELDGLALTHPMPLPDSLTDEEKYIIAGTEGSPWGDGLGPWWNTVQMIVRAYYINTGTIPDELSLEVVREISYNFDEVDPAWHDVYKSPLTDRWPKLNATEPSPGDMFIRPLSEAELVRYAEASESFANLYYNGVEECADCTYTARITTPVFFVRVYGWDGVIFETINFGYERL